jgi:hypothetical protein
MLFDKVIQGLIIPNIAIKDQPYANIIDKYLAIIGMAKYIISKDFIRFILIRFYLLLNQNPV